MSQNINKDAVTIEIEDLEEVVGGGASLSGVVLHVTPITQPSGGVRVSPGIFYNPDTCPTQPGTPVSTCMCPGTGIIGAAGGVSE